MTRRVRASARRCRRRRSTSGSSRALEAAAAATGEPYMTMHSGAAHDTMCVADRVPSAMVFVPCKDGISHHPAEDAEPGRRGARGRDHPERDRARCGKADHWRATPSWRALGRSASATSQHAPTSAKPSRPSPGSEKVRPTSGVPTRVTTPRRR